MATDYGPAAHRLRCSLKLHSNHWPSRPPEGVYSSPTPPLAFWCGRKSNASGLQFKSVLLACTHVTALLHHNPHRRLAAHYGPQKAALHPSLPASPLPPWLHPSNPIFPYPPQHHCPFSAGRGAGHCLRRTSLSQCCIDLLALQLPDLEQRLFFFV